MGTRIRSRSGRQGRQRLSRQRPRAQCAGRGRDPGMVGAIREIKGLRPFAVAGSTRWRPSLQGQGGAVSTDTRRAAKDDELAADFIRRHQQTVRGARTHISPRTAQGRPGPDFCLGGDGEHIGAQKFPN